MEVYKKLNLKIPDKPYSPEDRTKYTQVEFNALKEFKNFRVPPDYKRTVATSTGQFLIDVSQDITKTPCLLR